MKNNQVKNILAGATCLQEMADEFHVIRIVVDIDEIFLKSAECGTLDLRCYTVVVN